MEFLDDTRDVAKSCWLGVSPSPIRPAKLEQDFLIRRPRLMITQIRVDAHQGHLSCSPNLLRCVPCPGASSRRSRRAASAMSRKCRKSPSLKAVLRLKTTCALPAASALETTSHPTLKNGYRSHNRLTRSPEFFFGQGNEKSPMQYVSEVEPIKVEGLVAISHGGSATVCLLPV